MLKEDDDQSIIIQKKEIIIEKRLYNWNELPVWQHDNEYIISGYIRETRNMSKTFKTLFYLHNESINIYSHLIPSIMIIINLFIIKLIKIEKYETTNTIDYLIIDIFYIGSLICYSMSSIFHCIKAHSLEVAKFGNKLDYLGIIILIITSNVSILYYGYYEHPEYFIRYSILITMLGICCSIVSVKDKFRQRNYRKYRAMIFIIFGLSSILPIINGFKIYTMQEIMIKCQLKWMLLEGFFYIFGAILYGMRYPERLYIGKFDIIGSSHQIFHLFVVIANYCHLRGLIKAYELVHTTN